MMMLGFWTDQICERKTAALLRLVADENTSWALERLRRGKDIPREVSETGLLYCPDRASTSLLLVDGPALLDAGTGSCGSIAALEVGLRRAHAVFEDAVALPVARGRYQTTLLRRPGTVTIDYWHAVVRTPSGLVDPTQSLRQVCAAPEYA